VSCRSGNRQGGFVATELALGVAVLLLPVVFVVLTIPSWSERQTTGRAIAREVGRAVARDGWCNTGLANDLAEMMAANLALARADVRVGLDCAPGDALVPGSELAVTVTVRMPAVHVPALGTVGEWSWTARHREPVDLFGSAR
jgi:hypothetical protein